jgi:hypothetical protein
MRCIRTLVEHEYHPKVDGFDSREEAMTNTRLFWGIKKGPYGTVDYRGKKVEVWGGGMDKTEVWDADDNGKRWTAVFYWGD